MKRIICSLVGLCLLAAAGPTSAQEQSLADLARQTKAQRKQVKRPAKVYTNEDVPVVAAATANTQTELSTTPKDGQATPEGVTSGQAGAAGTAAGAKPGVAAGDEAKWRGRITAAREALSRAQLQLEAMRTRVLHLQSARTLGDQSQAAALQRQQSEALNEFDKLRADVEKSRKAVSDVEAEARVAGVPPGWLR